MTKGVFKRHFIVGLLTLLPLFVTVWVIWSLFRVLEKIWASLFMLIFGRYIPGLGPVLSLLLILATGVVATNVLGQRLIELVERLMFRIPVVNSIYSVAKEIVRSFSPSSKSDAFTSPVLVQFPREGMYSVGFVTGKGAGWFKGASEDLLRVFIPTTPNVTTGFLVIIPKEECIFLDIPMEQAMKVILSVGVLGPNVSPEDRNNPGI